MDCPTGNVLEAGIPQGLVNQPLLVGEGRDDADFLVSVAPDILQDLLDLSWCRILHGSGRVLDIYID